MALLRGTFLGSFDLTCIGHVRQAASQAGWHAHHNTMWTDSQAFTWGLRALGGTSRVARPLPDAGRTNPRALAMFSIFILTSICSTCKEKYAGMSALACGACAPPALSNVPPVRLSACLRKKVAYQKALVGRSTCTYETQGRV